jgi:thioredoxin 1
VPAFPAVTDDTFAALVAAKGPTTVLEFWTPGCGSCRQLARVLGRLEADLPDGVRIMTVAAHENPVLVDRFDVRSVPTVVILEGDEPVDRMTGVERRQVLRERILRSANAADC